MKKGSCVFFVRVLPKNIATYIFFLTRNQNLIASKSYHIFHSVIKHHISKRNISILFLTFQLTSSIHPQTRILQRTHSHSNLIPDRIHTSGTDSVEALVDGTNITRTQVLRQHHRTCPSHLLFTETEGHL